MMPEIESVGNGKTLQTDKYDLITQNKPLKDGGDTAHKVGHFCFIMFLNNYKEASRWYFTMASSYLFNRDKPWVMRRHPDPEMWYSDWDRFSRDQYTPILCYQAIAGHKKQVLRQLFYHLLRSGFMYNTRRNGIWRDKNEHTKKAPSHKRWDYSWKLPDWCGPEFISIYIRALRLYPLYFILIATDTETLIQSIITRFYSKDDDISNHAIVCLLNSKVMPTPTSWLANKINSAKDLSSKNKTHWTGKDPEWYFEAYKPLFKESFNE